MSGQLEYYVDDEDHLCLRQGPMCVLVPSGDWLGMFSEEEKLNPWGRDIVWSSLIALCIHILFSLGFWFISSRSLFLTDLKKKTFA